MLHGDTDDLFENVYSELSIYVIINFNLKKKKGFDLISLFPHISNGMGSQDITTLEARALSLNIETKGKQNIRKYFCNALRILT